MVGGDHNVSVHWLRWQQRSYQSSIHDSPHPHAKSAKREAGKGGATKGRVSRTTVQAADTRWS